MSKKAKKTTTAKKVSVKSSGDTKAKTNKWSMRDILIWVVIAVLLSSAIPANHYLVAWPFAVRISLFIGLVCVAAMLAYLTSHGKRFWKFALDARMELRKVVWPKREETMRITAFVAGLVVVMAIFMWGIDSLLLWLIGFVTG